MTASRFAQLRRCGLLVLFGCLALMALLVQFQSPAAVALTALGAQAVNWTAAAAGDFAASGTRVRATPASMRPDQAIHHPRQAPAARIAYDTAEQLTPAGIHTGVTAPAASAVELGNTLADGAQSGTIRLLPAERQVLPVTWSGSSAQIELPLFTGQRPINEYNNCFNQGHDQRQQTRCNQTEEPVQQSGQQGQWLLPQTMTPPQAPAGHAPPVPRQIALSNLPITNNDYPTTDWYPLPINQWDETNWFNVLPQQKQIQAPQQDQIREREPEPLNQVELPPPVANPDCPDNDAQEFAQVEADYNDIQIQSAPGADAATADDQF